MDAYTLWREVRIPRTGPGEDLIMTHSDLVLADLYVTTVIRYVEEGVFKLAPTDVLALLEELMRRIEQIDVSESEEHQAAARAQHAYAALLYLLYQQFLEIGASQETPTVS
ncbi:hypothetical protein [Kibdelosporangium aridum]|nr:hypothetical protein [Kibdelosporangium aridum]